MNEVESVFSQLFETLNNKQYYFGLETAVQQKDSSIRLIGGNFVLFYTPSSVEDNLWYGDCAANTLLVYKLLAYFGIHSHFLVVNTEFESPAAAFKSNHFSVTTNAELTIPLKLDHSIFYTHLQTPYKRRYICQTITHKENLINAQNISEGKNYKEFIIDGKKYLVSVTMGLDRINGSVPYIGVYIYEQNSDGDVVSRLLFYHHIPKEIPLTRAAVSSIFKFDTALFTHNHENLQIPFQNEVITSVVIDAFVDILTAYNRGLKQ